MRATEIAKEAVAEVLGPDDLAIDATAGNGHDALFLCQLAPRGLVFGFDIQPSAIAATRKRLEDAGIDPNRYCLLECGHEDMSFFCVDGCVSAIMFNLGYLPGGDKTVITRTETTLATLEEALPLLRPGGVLTIVCYPGHGGGDEEAEAVTSWAKALAKPWQVEIHPPAKRDGPFAIVVRNVA